MTPDTPAQLRIRVVGARKIATDKVAKLRERDGDQIADSALISELSRILDVVEVRLRLMGGAR